MTEDAATSLIWEADSTNPDQSEQVREALRQVMDPEIGLSVIELGLVRDLSIEDSKQNVKTSAAAAKKCPLESQCWAFSTSTNRM